MKRKKLVERKPARSAILDQSQVPSALQPGTARGVRRAPAEREEALRLQHAPAPRPPADGAGGGAQFTRTCGLGGMAVVLLVLLAGTGALLLLAYEPSAERAYASVQSLRDDTVVGGFVRNIHFWAANSLVLVAFLHLLRVFYTGAFHAPRRFNWIIGLLLLALVLVSNFTGYLLPWDQLAFWAVTIGTGMLEYVPLVGPILETALRGGAEVGPKTLSIFFVLHIAILPILGAILAAFHFWLVRKGGGVILPRPPGPEPAPRPTMVPTSPNLVFRELVVALVLVAGVLLTAAVFDAPLLAQANPGMSPNPAKAPWYFMGIQELLVHLHPAFAVLVVPLLRRGLPGVPALREVRGGSLGPLVPLGQWAAHGPAWPPGRPWWRYPPASSPPSMC